MSSSQVRFALARAAALGGVCVSAPSLAHAQPPAASDTAAVVRAIAAALLSEQPRPDSGQIDIVVRFWYIAPNDSLTARLAAAARYTTEFVPTGAVCPFPGAPAGAPTSSVTRMTLRFMAADTALVRLSTSCLRPRPSAVGTHFVQGDAFQLVRQGASWAIVSRSYFIS